MSDNSSNNKRIAKNAIYLYLRMAIVMVVTLYTTRVILQNLGIDDYGIYNLIAGVIALFSFVYAVLETSIQRFLNYEIGLTKMLEKAGFKSDFVIKNFYKSNNPTVFKWRKLYEKTDFPFVKCSVLRLKNYLHTTAEGWQDLFAQEQIELIEKNLKYTSRLKSMRHNTPKVLKEFVMEIIPKGTSKRAAIMRKLLEFCPIFID